jgi:hypothetical protein
MEWWCWSVGSEHSLQSYVKSHMNNDMKRQVPEIDKSCLWWLLGLEVKFQIVMVYYILFLVSIPVSSKT